MKTLLLLLVTTLQQPTLNEAIEHLRAQEFAEAAAALERITGAEPDNARAWQLLGLARHQQGEWAKALAAHVKAAGFPSVAPVAMYNAGAAYARLGKADKAFEWLVKAKATGRVDMLQATVDPDLESLKGDERFASLLPDPAEFEQPFVEPVRVLQEWRGEAANDQFGWIARNIGDVDGDGVNDVTTSAPTHGAGGSNAGRVYTYSGADGRLLWAQSGPDKGQLGLGIEAAGDVNADGVGDVVAGAPGAGLAFVYSGRNGEVLLTLKAEDPADGFGRKVSDVGDVNGDGHDDVLVGAPGHDGTAENTGRAYVFSGADGAPLLTLDGERAGEAFGSSGAGWVGGDKALIVVGAPGGGPQGKGRTYVFDCRGERRFVIEADDKGVALGSHFVSVVGDVDGDSTPDVYASDWQHAALGPNTGRIFVHSGATGERLLTLTGETSGEGFGIGPADAGDVNGDGRDDLVIGAWQFAGAARSGGRTYLFSGADGALLGRITCRVAGDTFGFDATGMGDVDGDGKPDFLITSAWSGVSGFHSGRMFIVAGR